MVDGGKLAQVLFRVLIALTVWVSIRGPVLAAEGSRKVFVLGLDGAAWRIILPLVNEGRLPNFKRLLDDGVYGALQSEVAFSPVSWTSIYTGMDRYGHGIESFYAETPLRCTLQIPSRAKPNRIFPASSLDQTAKPLWRILSEAGKRVGVVGFLLSYPAQPLNGVMITGDMTPNVFSGSPQRFVLTARPAEDGRQVFRGRVFGSAARLVELAPGRYRLLFEDDPETEFGEIAAGGEAWLRFRLDGSAAQLLSTRTDVRPTIRRAQWGPTPDDRPPPLQISLPSGISPYRPHAQLNRPLFLYIDATPGSESYDRVRFSYLQSEDACTETTTVYDVPLRARIARAGGDPSAEGEVLLYTPAAPEKPLRLTWPAAENGAERDLAIAEAAGRESGGEPWPTLVRWLTERRRETLHARTAFRRISKARLTIDEGRAVLEMKGIYDDFTFPTYQSIYPRDALAQVDISELPLDMEPRMWANHRLKEFLFEQVFDPDAFDCFMLCFTRTDKAQHREWNTPSAEDLDLGNHNRRLIDLWEELDGYVGGILDRLGPEWVVVAASDHGFVSVYIRDQIHFNWNRVLADRKLLRLRPVRWTPREPLYYQPARQTAYRVTIWYRCQTPARRPLEGSLLLLGEGGERLARATLRPGNDSYPATLWRPGTVVRCVQDLAFKESVRPGKYRLELQMHGRRPRGAPRTVRLAEIEIPETPRSLIDAHGLRRIGDVKVLEGAEAERILAEAGEPVPLAQGIELLKWRVEQVPSRYLPFLAAASPRVNLRRSRAVHLRAHDLEGHKLETEGIYLIKEPRKGDHKLLEDLAAMVRSVRIAGSDRPLFTRVRVDHEARCVTWKEDQAAYGSLSGGRSYARRSYDAAARVRYEFRGKTYEAPLPELVVNHCLGSHEDDGIYLISGETIPNLGPRARAMERDIAPTVLALMGLQPPASMDGTVIDWERPLEGAETSPGEELLEEELFEKLKAIGYLDTL
jgi:predicted AlkP superfamily phosphohydrolase/phosphomutase